MYAMAPMEPPNLDKKSPKTVKPEAHCEYSFYCTHCGEGKNTRYVSYDGTGIHFSYDATKKGDYTKRLNECLKMKKHMFNF